MAGPTLVSLFSGGGGLDYGLALAGFEARLAVEKEPYACQVLRAAQDLRHSLPNGRLYLERCAIEEGDVERLSDEDALRLARLRPGEATLLAGGPPCNTFSVAGRREGLASETGRLYRHYIRLLKAFAPQAFLFENVKGLLTAPGEEAGDRPAFDAILDELRSAGYAVTWRLLDAADYGVPQRRHRVIVLGRRGLEPLKFPDPMYAEPNRIDRLPNALPWRTVREAFNGLPDAVELGNRPQLRNHVAKRHSERTKASYAATPPGKRNQLAKRDRLAWDQPSKTIRAQGKPKADGSGQKNSSHQPLHPDEPRQLTPRECARLQTFPDWYPFPASLVNAYRIIGDAVPCELARVLGEAIMSQLEPEPLRQEPDAPTAAGSPPLAPHAFA